MRIRRAVQTAQPPADTRVEERACPRRAPGRTPQRRQDPLDVSLIATPSPDFSAALGVRFPNPPSGETPPVIRSGVARIRRIRDRGLRLEYGLAVLHEMLYLAECPDDMLTIANLIAEVREELFLLHS